MVKMINSVGCSIDGLEESDVAKFRAQGWVTEEEYKEAHPEEFEE